MTIKHKITPFCFVLLLSTSVLHASETPDKALPQLDPASSALIYSYDEMFNFDINQYLASQAPHLLPYAEVISHWAGYSSISPRVLLTLIDLQTNLISQPDLALLQQPLSGLSTQEGFSAQLQDVADQLARRLYQPQATVTEFAATPPVAALSFCSRRNQAKRRCCSGSNKTSCSNFKAAISSYLLNHLPQSP